MEGLKFLQPPKADVLDDAILKLTRFGVLSETELGAISQIASYFEYLKTLELQEPLKAWIFGIQTPEAVSVLKPMFDKNKKLKSDADADLFKLDTQIAALKSEIVGKNALVLGENLEILRNVPTSKLEFLRIEEPVWILMATATSKFLFEGAQKLGAKYIAAETFGRIDDPSIELISL